jgi:hypothetical protein
MTRGSIHTLAGSRGDGTVFVSDCRMPDIPERYTPSYARVVTPLGPGQTAYFRRGTGLDSALVVGAFDVDADSVMAAILAPTAGGRTERPWQIGLKAYQLDASLLPVDSFARLEWRAPVRRWTTAMPAPWDSMIAGMEVFIPPDSTVGRDSTIAGGVLGRARFVLRPPAGPRQRVRLSDLLFYAAAPDPLTGLEGTTGALARALGSVVLRDVGSVGVFWEAYGVQPGESVAFQLRVRTMRLDGGIASRVWRRLAGGGGRPVTIEWTEIRRGTSVPAGEAESPIWPRSLTLHLEHLAPGDYEMTLRAVVKGQEPVAVIRTFAVQNTAPGR